MNSVNPIRFTRVLFMEVNIILLARRVFVYTLHFTTLTISMISHFHFLEHLITGQTRDHMLRRLPLLLCSWQGGLHGDKSLSFLLPEIVLPTG